MVIYTPQQSRALGKVLHGSKVWKQLSEEDYFRMRQEIWDVELRDFKFTYLSEETIDHIKRGLEEIGENRLNYSQNCLKKRNKLNIFF